MKKLVFATRTVTVSQVYLREVEIADGLEGEELLRAADAALAAIEPAYPLNQDTLPWRTVETTGSRSAEWQVGEPGEWIASLADLCGYFGADSPFDLNRRIYKDTACGASISLFWDGGKFFLDSAGIGWEPEEWDESHFALMDKLLGSLESFTIQTIVEGSDATVDSDHFVLPCRAKDVADWMEEMEAEASRLWDEANKEQVV